MLSTARFLTCGAFKQQKSIVFPSGVLVPHVRCLRTSSPRFLHPILVALFKPISRVAAVLVGRRVRVWWKQLPEERRLVVVNIARRNKWNAAGAGLLGVGMLFFLYESHVEVDPLTNRRRFVALTPEQMEKIAAKEFEGLLETHSGSLLSDSHPAYGRVTRVASNIIKANMHMGQLAKKNWTVSVINDDVKNAFVLPSGNIFVFTGMLEACDNDEQLAIVLSHEIAHTLLNHVAEKLSYGSLVSLVTLVPLAVLWAFLPNDGIAAVADWFFNRVMDVVLELPFSREMESEADSVGLMLAARACVDVREAPVFWGRMAVLDAAPDEAVPELLSTHPAHHNRRENLTALVPSALQIRETCACPPLSPTDPNRRLEDFMAMMQKKQQKQLYQRIQVA